MYVFDSFFDCEISSEGLAVYVFQLCEEVGKFVFADESDAFEHGDVSDGAQNVVLGYVEVEFAVAAYGVALDFGVYLKSFVPKFWHCRSVWFDVVCWSSVLVWQGGEELCYAFDAFFEF